MNRWFSGNSNPVWGSGKLNAEDARTVAGRVARVIGGLDPDVLCVQEGPSAFAEMKLFMDEFLFAEVGIEFEALIGADGNQQKLYVLRKVNGQAASIDYTSDPFAQELREQWDVDVDGDLFLEPYDFTRQPLVVDVQPVRSEPFKIVVLHTKSKYVHNGERLFNDPARRQEFIAQAMKARRRISAEGFRVRNFLDKSLQQDMNARVVVTGDLNDGPGRDYFERFFLTHNVTDVVLGSTFFPELIFEHPILQRVQAPALFTARFDDFVDGIKDRPLLIDHFAVSPSLKTHVAGAGIGHDEFEKENDGGGTRRVDRPSDHRPIWLEVADQALR